ncbi:hypothetical protein V5O48_001755 [Marasmius crinis-equi]|uniref:Prokaryotic-type class I peptide chain release factors domain-containing protein n=1 Tax=Marasmius crinis-equi TaxID=585013 RepID=A0ABR3FY84_9AGAR
MSISAELRQSARSAYRALYRASSFTFIGDAPVLKAFREKMRQDALAARSETDPAMYQRYAENAREIATFLRRNIVQATRVEGATANGEEQLWSTCLTICLTPFLTHALEEVHINEHTELGDNDSIKNPPKMESSRSSRKREANLEPAAQPVPESSPRRSLNFSALKKAHANRKIPELNEADIEESFVRGSGPGGQSVNKTENNVQLMHKPTGLRVTCQETRSLSQNRKLARRILVEKLDQLHNPGLSKEEFKRAKQRERERRRRKKAKKKASAAIGEALEPEPFE